jgi:hypothetical protein
MTVGPASKTITLVAVHVGSAAGLVALVHDGYLVATGLQADRCCQPTEAGADDYYSVLFALAGYNLGN